MQELNIRGKIAIQSIRPIFMRASSKSSKWSKAVSSPDTNSDTPAKPKKKRASARKSRQGCKVCKARHRKCDETRPSCLSCVKGGWTCDYAEPCNFLQVRSYVHPRRESSHRGFSKTFLGESPAPSLPDYAAPEEGFYLEYIWKNFNQNPACPFEVPLWASVLQLCQQEPCIKQITIGTGMMHQIYRPIVENPGDPSHIVKYQAGFRHYSNAIQALKTKLVHLKGKPDRATWEIVLFTSFLFTAFEVLVGNEEGAYWQMQSGFKLLDTVFQEYGSSHDLPGNLEELTYAWNRVDIQAATFSLYYSAQHIFSPVVPDRFYSTYDAKNALERIIPNVLAFLRSREPDCYLDRLCADPLPMEMTKLEDFKTILQGWLDRFDELMERLEVDLETHPADLKETKLRVAHHTLIIQYWTVHVWLNTPFSHQQTIFDESLPAFVAIADLAEHILIMQPNRKDHYVAETGMVQPLSYVGRKCRDGKTRRRAIEILKVAGREGVWDGEFSGMVCEWIMKKEEEGLPEGEMGSIDPSSPNFVEEGFRLRGANISMNRLGKALKISCLRTREDGEEEVVEGMTQWGDVSSIVYGEVDKLWQEGGLFG